jgi:Tfp pilus assembly protein PilX
MAAKKAFRKTARGKEAGLSLIIVMMALIVMAIGAIGLIRMVDTGSLIAGNLAFKQSTTSAADGSVERAIQWLQGASDLTIDNTTQGYYATSLPTLDVTGKSTVATRVIIDWNGDGCAYAASGSYSTCKVPFSDVVNGDYKTSYLITRMCKITGSISATGNSCAKPVAMSQGTTSKGSVDYNNSGESPQSSLPYYRIVVRSVGPRNTTSFTETYVHFYPL